MVCSLRKGNLWDPPAHPCWIDRGVFWLQTEWQCQLKGNENVDPQIHSLKYSSINSWRLAFSFLFLCFLSPTCPFL